MERIKITCPNCNKTSVKHLNPELEINKVRCVKCGGQIEVRFEDDEIQLWNEVS